MRGGAIAVILIAVGTALALWLFRPAPAPMPAEVASARPTPPPGRSKAKIPAVRRAPLPPRPRHMPGSALAEISAYRAVPLYPPVAPTDLSPSNLLSAKLNAFAMLEIALASQTESSEGKTATEARLTLSSLHEDLAHALLSTDAPKYLGPDQATIYDETAEDLSDAHFDLALDAAESAAETVDAFEEQDPIRELLDDRIAFLSDR